MKLAIEALQIRNFLSFGPEPVTLKLRPLNVVIGPNGAGKSNLIEAIALLAATPDDLGGYFRSGGGSSQFLWKGGKENQAASIEVNGHIPDKGLFRHTLSFATVGQTYEIVDESISLPTPKGRLSTVPLIAYVNGKPAFKSGRQRQLFSRGDIDITQSFLSDLQELDFGRPLRPLERLYRSVDFFRARDFNQLDIVRTAQTTDLPNRYLSRTGDNLAAVLNRLMGIREAKKRINHFMSLLLEGYDGLTTQVQGGTIQLYLQEKGLRSPVPATRMSDGTIRWLALLAILTDPDPPPFLCIEEPETGLHPDVIVELGELLRDASRRTQLVVTTHSDTLVDSMTRDPENVVVCEKNEGRTSLKRLDREELAAWLDVYSLGPLWRRNLIGGVR